MERGASSPVWYAAVGALSGARTMAGPVLVCDRFREAAVVDDAWPASWLASSRVALFVHVGAVIEMVIDKLPIAGDRTAPLGLLARTFAGGVSGAALSSAHRRGWAVGTVLGALGAIAGTFATFHLRRALDRRLGLPGVLAGLTEDALLVSLRYAVKSRV